MDLLIRRASPCETEQLQQVGRQTFAETFAANNTEADLQAYLDEGFSKDKLLAELNDKNSEFYFALVDNRVAGYLKINFGPAQTELKDENALEIERIYVLREFLGKAVGQKLYDQAIQRAQQKQLGYVWLGVWEENHRAIRFYLKNGFVEFGKHLFKLGTDEQTDLLMKLSLTDVH